MIEKVGERYGTDYERCPRREEKRRNMTPQARGKVMTQQKKQAREER